MMPKKEEEADWPGKYYLSTPWHLRVLNILMARSRLIEDDLQFVIKPKARIDNYEVAEDVNGDYYGIKTKGGLWLIGDPCVPRWRAKIKILEEGSGSYD
jgi:hypothetical protein